MITTVDAFTAKDKLSVDSALGTVLSLEKKIGRGPNTYIASHFFLRVCKSGSAVVSLSQLCREYSISASTARRIVRQLVEAGLLSVEFRRTENATQLANRYIACESGRKMFAEARASADQPTQDEVPDDIVEDNTAVPEISEVEILPPGN
jgi:DNA-binding MarR family transcriptional regulator